MEQIEKEVERYNQTHASLKLRADWYRGKFMITMFDKVNDHVLTVVNFLNFRSAVGFVRSIA